MKIAGPVRVIFCCCRVFLESFYFAILAFSSAILLTDFFLGTEQNDLEGGWVAQTSKTSKLRTSAIGILTFMLVLGELGLRQ